MHGRHIEFRMWDKLLRKMMPDYNFVEFGNKEYEFMQATDYVDKNGKRIFEGDIITDGYMNVEVTVKKGCFGAQFAVYHTFFTDFAIIRDTNIVRDFEVIGNVFETPELLPK